MSEPSDTYVDVSAEFLGDRLMLIGHDIDIVWACWRDNGIVRLFLKADHLPPGQVRVIFERQGDGVTVVKAVEAV